MPDIFEVFSDHATTYLDFGDKRFRLEYKPGEMTPRMYAQITRLEEEDQDTVEIVQGDDGEEYTVFRQSDNPAGKAGAGQKQNPMLLALEKILISWDVQIGGETVPIEYDALMDIPGVFINAVLEAIINDQQRTGRRNRKSEGSRKGRTNSFQ